MNLNQWQIVSVSLDPTIGSEQGKTRPCVIISADYINERINTVVVLPITTRKAGRRIYPNEVNLPVESSRLPNESIILIHQVRAVDKKRIGRELGNIFSHQIQEEVFEAIDFNFDR